MQMYTVVYLHNTILVNEIFLLIFNN